VKNAIGAVGRIVIFAMIFSPFGAARDRARPQEVVEKVKQAAEALSRSGGPGLAQFNQKDSPWVWRCLGGILVA
jgi:cytochrome c